MRCANCGAAKIYAERPVDSEMVFHEIIRLEGQELFISYKDKNRRIVRAFTQEPEAPVAIAYNNDVLRVNGPAGSEVVVNFTIGR